MINELTTILVAASPISELRGAIPLAMEVFKFSPLKAAVISFIGNCLPVPIILYFLGPIEKILRRYKFFDKFFTWLFRRTRNKFGGKYLRWGELALALFVAVPLPVTGAWTGSLAAYLFGIPKKRALFFIFAGVLIAAFIVTVLDLVLANSFHFF